MQGRGRVLIQHFNINYPWRKAADLAPAAPASTISAGNSAPGLVLVTWSVVPPSATGNAARSLTFSINAEIFFCDFTNVIPLAQIRTVTQGDHVICWIIIQLKVSNPRRVLIQFIKPPSIISLSLKWVYIDLVCYVYPKSSWKVQKSGNIDWGPDN